MGPLACSRSHKASHARHAPYSAVRAVRRGVWCFLEDSHVPSGVFKGPWSKPRAPRAVRRRARRGACCVLRDSDLPSDVLRAPYIERATRGARRTAQSLLYPQGF